jgi:hypothetical protein
MTPIYLALTLALLGIPALVALDLNDVSKHHPCCLARLRWYDPRALCTCAAIRAASETRYSASLRASSKI